MVRSRAAIMKSAAKKKRSKKVLCAWCCLLTAALLLLLAVIFVILIFTVFKMKNPTIDVTSITLQNMSISNPNFLDTKDFTISAELDINATLHNPNVAGFEFGNSTVLIFYHGEQIADGPVPRGQIKGKGSDGLLLPLQITLSSDEINGNLTYDVLTATMLPLVSEVNVTGTATLGLIRIPNIRIHSECDINYYLTNDTTSFDCRYKTKI